MKALISLKEFWIMANKSLVIVESPSKAKTIGKYLGPEYLVKSSVGHIRRLTSGKKAIDPKDWSVSYEIDPKKTKVVQDLKKSAKGVDKVFLACLLYTSPSPRD